MSVIAFESETSEFLACSCGNTVNNHGFDDVDSECENPHYKCGLCGAYACVDFTMRIVNSGKTI